MTNEQGKAREFWVSELTEYNEYERQVISEELGKRMFGRENFWKSRYIHVIEYSAYLAEKERADRLEKALNKIGILSMSGVAHTREFTEKVETLCRDALDVKKKFPY